MLRVRPLRDAERAARARPSSRSSCRRWTARGAATPPSSPAPSSATSACSDGAKRAAREVRHRDRDGAALGSIANGKKPLTGPARARRRLDPARVLRATQWRAGACDRTAQRRETSIPTDEAAGSCTSRGARRWQHRPRRRRSRSAGTASSCPRSPTCGGSSSGWHGARGGLRAAPVQAHRQEWPASRAALALGHEIRGAHRLADLRSQPSKAPSGRPAARAPSLERATRSRRRRGDLSADDADRVGISLAGTGQSARLRPPAPARRLGPGRGRAAASSRTGGPEPNRRLSAERERARRRRSRDAIRDASRTYGTREARLFLAGPWPSPSCSARHLAASGPIVARTRQTADHAGYVGSCRLT